MPESKPQQLTNLKGKRRSALNALRHGLTGHVIVMPEEDHRAYVAFSKRWFDDLQPQGIMEESLVQQMADCQWVINRARSIIQALEAIGHNGHIKDTDSGHPEADNILAAGLTFQEFSQELDKLSRYRGRWVREFNSAMKELRQLQAERKESEKQALEQAIDLFKLHRMLEEPFRPHEFGFVLPLHQIAQQARIADRIQAAATARKVGYDAGRFHLAQAS